MGSDLYHLHREIAAQSHGPLVALLTKIRKRLREDEIGGWDDLIAEIDRELNNARIA